MDGYTGKDLFATWTWSGGTVDLADGYRTFKPAPSVELYDDTAGNDTHKSHLVGLKDNTYEMAGLHRSADTMGSALASGIQGTLTYGIQGTATGKPKVVAYCTSNGIQTNVQYNNTTEWSCTFQGNGTATYTAW